MDSVASAPSGGYLLGGTAKRKISSSSIQSDFLTGRNESKKSIAGFSVAESKALSHQLTNLLKERQQRKQRQYQRGLSVERRFENDQRRSQMEPSEEQTNQFCDYAVIDTN